MKCDQARHWLDAHGKRPIRDYPDEMRAHIDTCAECRRRVQDLQLQYTLRQLPVPAPAAGYVDRALNEAWEAKARQHDAANKTFTLSLALAASVMVVAVGVKLATVQAPVVPIPVTALSTPPSTTNSNPAVVQQLDLLLQSPQTYANTNIRLEFSDSVKLVGYNGINELHWQTVIKQGNNQISLPLELSGMMEGRVTIHVEALGRTKQMSFVVGAGTGAHVAGLITLPNLIPSEV